MQSVYKSVESVKCPRRKIERNFLSNRRHVIQSVPIYLDDARVKTNGMLFSIIYEKIELYISLNSCYQYVIYHLKIKASKRLYWFIS